MFLAKHFKGNEVDLVEFFDKEIDLVKIIEFYGHFDDIFEKNLLVFKKLRHDSRVEHAGTNRLGVSTTLD